MTDAKQVAEARERLKAIANNLAWQDESRRLCSDLAVLLSALDQAEKVLEPFAEAAREVDDLSPELVDPSKFLCPDNTIIGTALWDHQQPNVSHLRAASNLLNQLRGVETRTP